MKTIAALAGIPLAFCPAASAHATQLTILAAEPPPMTDKAGKGREADSITRTATARGDTAIFEVFPFGRQFGIYNTESNGRRRRRRSLRGTSRGSRR